MKTSFFRIAAVLISTLSLAACSNSLWYGGDGTGDLTLRLEMPATTLQTTDNSRALALQGVSVFVEIADIQDVGAYTDPNGDENTSDSLFYTIPDGDGNWVDTTWGGHAVIHASALGTGEFSIAFNGVPKDRDLLIRVIQDTSRSAMESGMPNYAAAAGSPWYPISQTFVSGGSGSWQDMGRTLSSAEMADGVVHLYLRPNASHPDLTDPYYSESSSTALDFVSDDPDSEPDSGNTKFTNIRLDMMNSGGTVDPGLLIGYRIQMSSTAPAPGFVIPYEKSGRLIPPAVVHNVTSGITRTITSYVIVPAPLDGPQGQNNDYFFGSTVYPGVILTSNPLYTGFNVVIRPMVNGSIQTFDFSFAESVLNSHTVKWGIPDTGVAMVEKGDLEYRVLIYTSPDPIPGDRYDINQIEDLGPLVALDWDKADQFVVSDPTYDYSIDNIKGLLGDRLNPLEGDNFRVYILARVPGGTPFLIAVNQSSYNAP